MSVFHALMDVIAAVITLAAIVVGVVAGIGSDGIFLSLLGAAAGWLRFKLALGTYITLSPIAFFVAILVVQPQEAFFVAVASALLSSLAFGRRGSREAFWEAGQEGVSALAALALFAVLSMNFDIQTSVLHMAVAYSFAVIAYATAKLAFGIAASWLLQGISARSYVISASKSTLANLFLLGLIAFGIRVSLYGEFGYLALVLATIALVELYHPWKLLTEQDEILFANLAMVAQAIDIKDPYTARHSRNVADLAVRIARAMRLAEGEVRKIRIGALMHDIGKIGVSSSIIRKPSKLEPAEASAMREHPVISADIMQPIELLEDAAEIVRHHHEHFDGSGYPAGLRGEEIPVGARVILVADAFDAMTTDRPYRRSRSKEEALRVLKDHAGRQFDAGVVTALEKVLQI